jgi:hypothetical protein
MIETILSNGWENLCHFLFVELLKILYWNPTFKMQHAITMDKCTFSVKDNWFEGTIVFNVFKNMTVIMTKYIYGGKIITISKIN